MVTSYFIDNEVKNTTSTKEMNAMCLITLVSQKSLSTTVHDSFYTVHVNFTWYMRDIPFSKEALVSHNVIRKWNFEESMLSVCLSQVCYNIILPLSFFAI